MIKMGCCINSESFNWQNIGALDRSGKPAKGQIICQRTDYLSFDRLMDLLKQQTEAVRTEDLSEKLYKL